MKLAAGIASLLAGTAFASSADDDLITNLPGAEGHTFTNMYSGYLDLPNSEKHVFYWYVEATESPETAPVTFWTNGGPGCSGLIGFMTEQGPFHVGPTGGLEKNPYAWNYASNMLFVEQPVGVGFSWSGNDADYTMGDYVSAALTVCPTNFPSVKTVSLRPVHHCAPPFLHHLYLPSPHSQRLAHSQRPPILPGPFGPFGASGCGAGQLRCDPDLPRPLPRRRPEPLLHHRRVLRGVRRSLPFLSSFC